MHSIPHSSRVGRAKPQARDLSLNSTGAAGKDIHGDSFLPPAQTPSSELPHSSEPQRLPVPKRVRDDLLSLLGSVDEPLRSQALRFIWGAWHSTAYDAFRGELTEEKLLNHERVKRWLGVGNDFPVGDFLRALRDETPLSVNYSSYDVDAGRARRLRDLGLPSDLEAIWNDGVLAKLEGNGSAWVDLFTGKPAFTKRVREQAYKQAKREARAAAHARGNDDLLRRIDVLNSQSRTWFTSTVRSNLPRAVAWVLADYEEGKRRDDLLKQLALAKEYPMPIYKPSKEGTLRVHTHGAFHGLHGLPREVRDLFLESAVGLDLRSIHAALAARLWGVESLTGVLQRGSLWEYLYRELSVSSDIKGHLKVAFYSLVYGMRASAVSYTLTRSSKVEGLGSRFLALEPVADLLTRRAVVFEQAKSRGLVGPYGETYKASCDDEVKRTLALHAQAFESYLMAPAFNEAEGLGLRIIFSNHDGLSVVSRRKPNNPVPESALEALCEVVNRRLAEHKILSTLEADVKNSPPHIPTYHNAPERLGNTTPKKADEQGALAETHRSKGR